MPNKIKIAKLYKDVRLKSEELCKALEIEDYVIQSTTDTSPPK